MQKFVLLLIVCISAFFANAQNNSKYLAGAVPEKEGHVFFSKTIKANNLTKDEIYKVVSDWAKLKFVQEKGFRRKLTADSSMVYALGDDYLVFQNTPLSLDRTHFMYDFKVNCSNGACEIEIFRIIYLYKTALSDTPEKYTAEEMISDASALKKGKLVKSTSKFRIKTIDYIDEIYNEIESLLGKEALKK